jgi:hypothetical protein
MIILSGASWSYDNKFSSLYKNKIFPYIGNKEVHAALISDNVIEKEIKNFRRISLNSKVYSILTGLVLHDSDINMSPEIELNTGIISCTYDAATPDNEKYFRDYISAGRRMGRGNLFVYTLPTSALGEVAISYQLKGPLFYSNYLDKRFEMFLEQIEFMLQTDQAENLVCIFTDKDAAICMFFSNNITKFTSGEYLTMDSIKNKLVDDVSAVDSIQILKNMFRKKMENFV